MVVIDIQKLYLMRTGGNQNQLHNMQVQATELRLLIQVMK
jgi:hypothetical protein